MNNLAPTIAKILIILLVGSGAAIFRRLTARRTQKPKAISINNLPESVLMVPPLPEKMPTWAPKDSVARVERIVAQFSQMPWGQAHPDATTSRAHYEAGIQILDEMEADFSQSTRAIEEFLQCDPALAWTGGANTLMRLSYVSGSNFIPQGIREALRYTTQAINIDKHLIDPWILRIRLAALYAGPQNIQLAEQALTIAHQLDPDNPRVAFAESILYRTTKERDKRLAVLQKLSTVSESAQWGKTQRVSVWDALAFLLLETGKPDEAIVYFDLINQEKPESAWSWHNAAIAYNQAGRYAEALERSDRALDISEFGVARHLNNVLRLKLGMSVPGIDHPQTAEAREESANVYREYAVWLAKQPDVTIDEVIAIYQRALLIAPNVADLHYSYGLYLLNTLHDPSQASFAFEEAHRLDPDDMPNGYRYASTVWHRGSEYASVAEATFKQLLAKGNYWDIKREYAEFLLNQDSSRWAEAGILLRTIIVNHADDETTKTLLARFQAATAAS